MPDAISKTGRLYNPFFEALHKQLHGLSMDVQIDMTRNFFQLLKDSFFSSIILSNLDGNKRTDNRHPSSENAL